VLQSFADKETRKIWNEERSKRLPPDIQQRALLKLAMISQAIEALKGNRSGQFSIRINQQWRICFRWENGHAHDVEITDYH
jgi:proteic killer suppression protein